MLPVPARVRPDAVRRGTEQPLPTVRRLHQELLRLQPARAPTSPTCTIADESTSAGTGRFFVGRIPWARAGLLRRARCRHHRRGQRCCGARLVVGSRQRQRSSRSCRPMSRRTRQPPPGVLRSAPPSRSSTGTPHADVPRARSTRVIGGDWSTGSRGPGARRHRCALVAVWISSFDPRRATASSTTWRRTPVRVDLGRASAPAPCGGDDVEISFGQCDRSFRAARHHAARSGGEGRRCRSKRVAGRGVCGADPVAVLEGCRARSRRCVVTNRTP